MNAKKIVKTEEKESTALAPVTNFLQENRSIGMEEVDSSDLRIPVLMFIQRNSNTEDDYGNLLSGQHAGKFYHKGLKTIHEAVDCVILGFTKKKMPAYNKPGILDDNYIVLGMLKTEQAPFLLYLRSYSIGAFKNILNDAINQKRPIWSFYTKILGEPAKIEKEVEENGQKRKKVFNFHKIKFVVDELIDDIDTLQTLKALSEKYRFTLEGAKSETQETDAEEVSAKQQQLSGPDDASAGEHTENVDVDKIPF